MVGISDSRRLVVFLVFFVDTAVEPIIVSKCSAEDMVGVFLHSENHGNCLETQVHHQTLLFFPFGEPIINIPVVKRWVIRSDNI